MCPSTVPQVVFSVKRKACHRAQLWQSACIVCEANGQQRAAAWGGVHQEACPHHLPTQCCCQRARSHRRHAVRKAGQLRPMRTISMHTPVSRNHKTRLRPACLCSKQYHQQLSHGGQRDEPYAGETRSAKVCLRAESRRGERHHKCIQPPLEPTSTRHLGCCPQPSEGVVVPASQDLNQAVELSH